MTELEQLEAIRQLLEFHLSAQGFGLGFGLGIVTSGGWLLVLFVRRVFQDRDE